MSPTHPPLSADAVTAVPIPADPFDADPISLRLDAIDATLDSMKAGLVAMIEMLDGFAQRAEPLLAKAEQRGRLFGRQGGN